MTIVIPIKIDPRKKVWEVTEKTFGSINWGRNARKNIDSFGLRILIKTPCQNIECPD
jgi:hypothetical protein